MRLKAEIWVKAYLRRCRAAGAEGFVVRHGDDDAGAIFVRVNRLDGTSLLFGPAPAGLGEVAEDRLWTERIAPGPQPDASVEALLGREIAFDPDIWIVEIEARDGAHHLGGWLLEEST